MSSPGIDCLATYRQQRIYIILLDYLPRQRQRLNMDLRNIPRITS